jgi:hypothetical protein
VTRIVLVRHGRVACDRPLLLDRAGFAAWRARSDKASLAEGAPPPGLTDLCRGATLFTSVAPCARQTAMRLAPQRQWRFDPLFSEEPATAPDVFGRWPLAVWLALARAGERFGAAAEPQRRALRDRARQAARILIDAAPSLLVGHDRFNRGLADALADEGFVRAPAPLAANAPWGTQVFTRPDA